MPEPTSIDSYRQAHESGLIGQRQMEVLAFVIANEPCNQGDVSRHFADASSSYQPRFRELEDAGVIEQRGTKVDPATSRVVKAYTSSRLAIFAGTAAPIRGQPCKKSSNGPA